MSRFGVMKHLLVLQDAGLVIARRSGRVRASEQFKAASLAQGYPCPDVIIEGEVLEADLPRRLVTTFRMLMDPEVAAEPLTRVIQEIAEGQDGVCSLILTHELDGAPKLRPEPGSGGRAAVMPPAVNVRRLPGHRTASRIWLQ